MKDTFFNTIPPASEDEDLSSGGVPTSQATEDLLPQQSEVSRKCFAKAKPPWTKWIKSDATPAQTAVFTSILIIVKMILFFVKR